MRLDYCSSLNCSNYGCDYCKKCSHATFIGSAKIGKRTWTWEFNPVFGPIFFRKDGEERKIYPDETHPVWPFFNKWLKEKGVK